MKLITGWFKTKRGNIALSLTRQRQWADHNLAILYKPKGMLDRIKMKFPWYRKMREFQTKCHQFGLLLEENQRKLAYSDSMVAELSKGNVHLTKLAKERRKRLRELGEDI